MCTEDFDSTDDIEEIGDGCVDDVEVDDAGDECAVQNPWAWADGKDPADIEKTYSKFTQRTQDLSASEKAVGKLRDDLAPLNKLRETLENDPGLVKAIEQYFANEGGQSDMELSKVQKELEEVKTSIYVEKELGEVSKWVEKEGYPSFDEDELLTYAAENRIGNLKAAYRDMNFEKVQERKADQLTEDIKRGKGAALPKSRRADTGGKAKYTEEDIEHMSEDDFKKNFTAILDSF